MKKIFEEIDSQSTPLGEISLRRRSIASLGGVDVFEVKLGDEYLMSSLFHEVEIALADLGLAELPGNAWDVVVGGLGLGYTAVATLAHEKVASLIVVEALSPVIKWHREALVPLGEKLVSDPRCRFVHGDFFALAGSPKVGFDPEYRGRRFHAVLLDIDHSPNQLLSSGHGDFYEVEGLRRMSEHLRSDGVFALWSDDPPDNGFLKRLEQAFGVVRAQVVRFQNPLRGEDSASTVYVATGPKP